MMHNYDLPYGNATLAITIPDTYKLLGVVDVPEQKPVSSEKVIREALENPIGTPPLRKIVAPGESVCIVLSDITRAWQQPGIYLPFIVEELKKGGVREEDMHFLCATGTHRGQTPEEAKKLLGPALADRFSLISHDCKDDDSLVFLGTTSFGTPVRVNKLAMECDRLVITGGISYHSMAGGGGGRKAVLPGISGYETVQINHNLALLPERGKGRNFKARTGNFEDNPIHLDMIEACAMAKPDFLFNVIMGTHGITAAVAGDWQKAFTKGMEKVESLEGVPFEEKADFIVASSGGFPKDILLYQSSKAIFNAVEALRDGGVLIALMECPEGIGSEEMQDIMTNYPDAQSREEALRKVFTIARYVGYLVEGFANQFHIIVVSSLPPEKLEGSAVKVISTYEEALSLATALLPKDAATYVLPHGGNILPQFN